MSRLPVCSGTDAVKAFRKIGYEVDHQTGSHIILRHLSGRRLSVPNHRELAKGTLRALIREAGVTKDSSLICSDWASLGNSARISALLMARRGRVSRKFLETCSFLIFSVSRPRRYLMSWLMMKTNSSAREAVVPRQHSVYFVEAGRVRESRQRDSIHQPRVARMVARNELPWANVETPTGLYPFAGRRMQSFQGWKMWDS
jgi:predicted RNA binding protein YcfA (HicA-like mRNA interferase family)